MRTAFATAFFVINLVGTTLQAQEPPLPKVAEGWSVELVARAPSISSPTAVVVAPDGTIFVGQDPMDMSGPPTVPADSVVAIKDGKISKFADKLWAVMGLEWVEGTLYVVHAPYLSAFRDVDGDGKADSREDLITGLGPKIPGFNGINDHIASGIRLGIDGFLYVSIGDKGLPRATARDGKTITMSTGGVIRIRPDGTGLEVVSTGERNPLSVALSRVDDVFTYGNDDDSKKWPNSLTHHIVGGHYGYPYEFLTAPFRALPIVDGQFGGSGAQGISYNEDGLPAKYRGNLFFCDWGQQKVIRYEVEPSGASFKVVKKEPLVEKGELDDFRPFAIATSADGSALYLTDWAFNGWLSSGPPAGRLFRLTYTGADGATPSPRPTGHVISSLIKGLDHPALAVRRDSQRQLAAKGDDAIPALMSRLNHGEPPSRVHALWALDAIQSSPARVVIRTALDSPDPELRAQAARSSGLARDPGAVEALGSCLKSTDPVVRREAAIALGQIGIRSAERPLYAALGDPDQSVSWSIRKAIRKLDAWNPGLLKEAFADPKRREDALKLTDESWSLVAVQVLSLSLDGPSDSGWKIRALAALAGNYQRYPDWSGQWFGTNPLAGAMPRKTVDWNPDGMNAVLIGLIKGLKESDPLVRRQAIVGLAGVGDRALPLLRNVIDLEPDSVNLAAAAKAVGGLRDVKAAPSLAKLLGDPNKPIEARVAAMDSLALLNSPLALNSRLTLVYDKNAPEALVARALPPLGRSRVLPANDLAGFLESPAESVRVAALQAFPTGRMMPVSIRTTLLSKLDDPSPLVRKAAIVTMGEQKLVAAIPRLVALADQDEFRADATRALAEMPDPRAVSAYAAGLSDRDPAVRTTSELALKQIREVASTELQTMAKEGKFVGPSALAVERILTKFRPVTDWKVIGPFPRATALLFDEPAGIDFERNQVGVEGRTVSWKNRRAEPTTGRVIIDDLKDGVGDKGGFGYDPSNSPDLAAFAYAEIKSDQDRPALLLVGSSGSVAVRLNDLVVLNEATASGRVYAIDSNTVRITLKKGVNRFVVRSRQGIGLWSFGLMISEPASSGLVTQPPSIGAEGLRTYALTHQGDPVSGERLFFESKGLGCARCHAVDGKGTANIGPDLTGLANKYQKEEIIRSVLEPSNRLATGFQPLLISRRDGTVQTGLLRNETDDDIDLVDIEGKPFRIAKSEIDERKVSDLSMMPAGLCDSLSAFEFTDLIAYLGSLKTSK